VRRDWAAQGFKRHLLSHEELAEQRLEERLKYVSAALPGPVRSVAYPVTSKRSEVAERDLEGDAHPLGDGVERQDRVGHLIIGQLLAPAGAVSQQLVVNWPGSSRAFANKPWGLRPQHLDHERRQLDLLKYSPWPGQNQGHV